MEGKWAPQIGKENKYGYNGKELNTDFGLNWNMYEFRPYDPAIGKFTSVDLLSETYSFQSPYAYAANNPINNIDFLGLGPGDPPVGSEDNPEILPEIVVTASRITKKARNLNHTGDTNNSDRPGLFFDRFADWKSECEGCGLSVGEIDYPSSPWVEGVKNITFNMMRIPEMVLPVGGAANGVQGLTTMSRRASALLKVGNGGDYVAPMNIVREIRKGENLLALIKSIQERTFTTGVEHAIVRLGKNSVAPGARVLVSGGRDGITFAAGQIRLLIGHTHPYVTGASKSDLKALRSLGQYRQYIFEAFNDAPIILKR